jgi:hypothetical protein
MQIDSALSTSNAPVDLMVAESRGNAPELRFVATDRSVQDELRIIASSTFDRLGLHDPRQYDPANTYQSEAYLLLPTDSPLAAKCRYIYTQQNCPEIGDPNLDLPRTKLYAARFWGAGNNAIVGCKTVTDFSKRLRRQKLMTVFNDSLTLDDRPQFQLENHFDFVITDSAVHILRPKAFETACNLSDAVKQAAAENLRYLHETSTIINFVDFVPIGNSQVRAARAVASLRLNGYLDNLDRELVEANCTHLQIEYLVADGRISIAEGSQVKFLQMLCRQILGIELKKGERETYFASNREPL